MSDFMTQIRREYVRFSRLRWILDHIERRKARAVIHAKPARSHRQRMLR